MEEAMANMKPEYREALLSQAEFPFVPADEILFYLDFDGATVRLGNANSTGFFSPIIGVQTAVLPPPNLTQAEKDDVLRLVQDDYSPFNIRFTTDRSVFFSYPFANKEIAIISTNPRVAGFSPFDAGVAPFVGTGQRLPSNPSFIFADFFGHDTAAIAGVVSQETGHTMGLGHQHLFHDDCSFVTEYHPTFGAGVLAFTPIMGEAFGDGITNWYAQSCLSPIFGVAQDDFGFINRQVVLKNDDFPDGPGRISMLPPHDVNGIRETGADVDLIPFFFRDPVTISVTSDNIDLKVSVCRPSGRPMREYNDPDGLNVTFPVDMFGPGYIRVEGGSNANVSAQFMTGQYTLTVQN
jgi:hypothetical protein